MSNSETFVLYMVIISIIITVIGASIGLIVIYRDKKRKSILERKKRLQEDRNYIYVDQCLLHLKNGSIGEFDAVFNLITDKSLQSNLYFLFLGMGLNTTKKREQNKIIKIVKHTIKNNENGNRKNI